jgi:Na+-transporting methylmalonyl-CoA/oxaloacetate decarboxylase gamma subunit
MEHLNPEIQQVLITIGTWLLATLGGLLIILILGLWATGKFIVTKFIGGAEAWKKEVKEEAESLKNSLNEFKEETVAGIRGITEALHAHANDLSNRIERTNSVVALHKQLLDTVKERTDKAIPELYEKVDNVKNKHDMLQERILKHVIKDEK